MLINNYGISTYTQAFNTENQLTSVTVGGQVTTFAYDPDGNLVKKINPDGSKTLYIAGIYEVNKNSGGSVTGTVTYYPEAGAMRVDTTPYYVLKDHLGSASVITDSTGTTVGEQRYYPFGETRVTTGTIPTDKLFTGQREMAGLGIYHYGARFRAAPRSRAKWGFHPNWVASSAAGFFSSAITAYPLSSRRHRNKLGFLNGNRCDPRQRRIQF